MEVLCVSNILYRSPATLKTRLKTFVIAMSREGSFGYDIDFDIKF